MAGEVGLVAVGVGEHLVDGYALGMARFRIRSWPFCLVWAVGAAMLLHFFWDRTAGQLDVQDAGFAQWVLVGLALTAMALFGLAVSLAARRSREVFAPKGRKRLWGWPFSSS